MSDCHRGSGDNYDNFIKNRNIFEAALRYYYINNFTYIELGDGDEMWEIKDYKEIIDEHLSTFKILKKFNDSNKLIMIYGNHDILKKDEEIMKKYFYKYYDKSSKKEEDLLVSLPVYESLILEYKNHEIFMLHGHQVDFINSTIWKVTRFLVRHIWRHFERFFINDPTSSAKNYLVSKKTEKKLDNWSKKNGKILIAGHTHRPVFPENKKSLYFNDGSCIHPNGITCLEIQDGNIVLVKWSIRLENKTLHAKREIISGNAAIISFFD